MDREVSGHALGRSGACDPPTRAILSGDRVDLERLDPARHAAELYAASHEDESARRVSSYLPVGPFVSASAFESWLAGMAADPAYLFYAIRPAGGSRASGLASYLDIRPRMGAIEIGYIWFAPDLQRTPGATESLFLMLTHAMDDLGYRRMQWRCNALNEKSRASAVRLGFRYEGIFHHHMIVKGHNRDTAWYSILDHEWPRLRENFAAWLSPSNFDPGGRQKRSLSALNAIASPGTDSRREAPEPE